MITGGSPARRPLKLMNFRAYLTRAGHLMIACHPRRCRMSPRTLPSPCNRQQNINVLAGFECAHGTLARQAACTCDATYQVNIFPSALTAAECFQPAQQKQFPVRFREHSHSSKVQGTLFALIPVATWAATSFGTSAGVRALRISSPNPSTPFSFAPKACTSPCLRLGMVLAASTIGRGPHT